MITSSSLAVPRSTSDKPDRCLLWSASEVERSRKSQSSNTVLLPELALEAASSMAVVDLPSPGSAEVIKIDFRTGARKLEADPHCMHGLAQVREGLIDHSVQCLMMGDAGFSLRHERNKAYHPHAKGLLDFRTGPEPRLEVFQQESDQQAAAQPSHPPKRKEFQAICGGQPRKRSRRDDPRAGGLHFALLGNIVILRKIGLVILSVRFGRASKLLGLGVGFRINICCETC